MAVIHTASHTASRHRCVHDDPVGSEKGQRQAPGVDALHVGEASQRVGVEGEHGPGEHPGGSVSGPFVSERVPRPGGQREPEDQHDVEDQDGRGAEPVQRRAHQRRDDQRFGERERVPLGIEDVPVEEPRRRAWQLVRHPRQNPLVELRVGVVVAGQRARGGDEWPGVDDRQQQTEAGDRSRLVA